MELVRWGHPQQIPSCVEGRGSRREWGPPGRRGWGSAHVARGVQPGPLPQHTAEFSMTGKLMGTLGLLCMSPNLEVGMAASEALHYLFKVLALQRSEHPGLMD